MKEVFTTGQVADFCEVCPRTVAKWFDSGRLSGYRIPASQHRRIPREKLILFLKEYGLPLGELEEKKMVVVLCGIGSVIDETRDALDGDIKVVVALSTFDAGFEAYDADYVVLDEESGPELSQAATSLEKYGKSGMILLDPEQNNRSWDPKDMGMPSTHIKDSAIIASDIMAALNA